MSGSRLGGLLRYLRRVSDAEGTGDAQLLQRFVRQRDEAAFAELVDRHGPMVLGVRRRVLRDPHDAEDAFQATFLVLAHKARSISRPQALGGWLHCVARRTALRARLDRGRRRTQDSVLDDLPAAETTQDLAWHELRPALDEEVGRLPRKYREPVVLRHLQEKTYAEAAKDLGLAAGTVSSRLARARDLLRKRLVRRGLTLSSGLLVGLLSQRALSAAVPGALRDATTGAVLRWATGRALLAGAATESVAALTAGVLRTMFLAKMRFLLIVVLAVGVVAFGLGAGMYARWSPPDPPASPAAPEPGQQPEKKEADRRKTFENEFGYTWFIHPWDVGERVAERDASEHWAGMVAQGGAEKSKEAMTLLLVPGSGGDLYLIQNHMGPLATRVQYRPVILDAEGKRYVPTVGTQGGSGNGDMHLRSDVYHLTARDLPIHKVRYVGVEQLTLEGRKAIDARALERARKAGIEVLPPGYEGEAYDFTLTTLDGKQVRAADLRGRMVLIHCWSTTYNPNAEGLKQLYDRHHKDGLEIIGVCLDQDAARVKKVCAEKGLTWPQVLVPVKDEKTRQLWIEATGLREGTTRCLDRKGVCLGDAGNNPHHLLEIKTLTGLDR